MEKFIKTELSEKINLNNQTDTNNFDFFGSFHGNPTQFKFSMGERYLINELSTFVNTVIKEKGIQFFSLKTSSGKKHKISYKNTTNFIHLGRLFTEHSFKTNSDQNVSKKHQADLHNKILCFMKSKGFGEEVLRDFDVTKVSIEVGIGNSITGVIPCVLCSDLKPYRINSKQTNEDKVYWILSNYQKHLNKDHQMQSGQQIVKKTLKRQKADTTKNIENKMAEGVENSAVTTNTESVYIQILNPIDTLDKEEVIPFPELNLFDEPEKGDENSKNTTCVALNIESYSPKDDVEYVEKYVYSQISEQSLKMTKITFENQDKFGKMEFVQSNETHAVDVATIPSDGNCLFSTLSHQIFGLKILSRDHEDSVKKLRADVVEYIYKNLKTFKLELEECILIMKGKKVKSNTKIKIEDFERESNFFLSKSLSKDGFWGGFESIRAVSMMYKVNILLINEGGTAYFASGFQAIFEKTIMLAYRLNALHNKGLPTGGIRNHYESVVSIDTETVLEIAERIAKSNENNLTSEAVYLSDSSDS